MTPATVLKRPAIYAVLLAALVNFQDHARAQSPIESDVVAAGDETNAVSTIDRGKLRLKLLITLVENEMQEATLLQSQLTIEAAGLDQQRRTILAEPSSGSRAEKRQLDVIDERLVEIDREMAEVNARVPEINAELAELQARLDEANGVIREQTVDNAANGTVTDGASQWLDSKRQVQEALVYLGDYNALIDGDFGPRTRQAIEVYQTRQNVERTGALTNEQEAALLEEADILRARYGMKTAEDRERGYRFSYPSGLLTRLEEVNANERRYLTADGKGEIIVTSSDNLESDENGVADLSAIYEGLLAQYEVQYRRKRNDWFVVAGLAEEGRIVYDTARLGDNRVIRARLTYPAEWRDLWSPFAVIMFNTFEAVSSGES